MLWIRVEIRYIQFFLIFIKIGRTGRFVKTRNHFCQKVSACTQKDLGHEFAVLMEKRDTYWEPADVNTDSIKNESSVSLSQNICGGVR